MTNLKTLKDIEWCLFNDSGKPREAVFKEELKQEAIKWVKENRKESAEHKRNFLLKEYYNESEEFRLLVWCDARAGMLIQFFNLTEEDLK